MRRLLSDPLPLRSTTDLPSYREQAPLPWVYGTVTLAPIPWDTTGRTWLLADHPIAAVHWVAVGGRRLSGWSLDHVADPLGRMVALLRLAKPAESAPAVSLSGRRHATTGALIAHPADIADDLFVQCGWPVDPDLFRPLREAWPDLALGGVLAAAEPLREAVTRVVRMVGADWSAYPLRAWMVQEGAAQGTLTQALIDDGAASADHVSLATVLRATYAHDWAEGKPRGVLILECPEAIGAYGRMDLDLDLSWVRGARDALALATLALQAKARPQWSISLTLATSGDYLPGDRLELTHPWLPQGTATIATVARDQSAIKLELTRPAGALPAVALAGRGALVDAVVAGLGVDYSQGTATFTIQDTLGVPMAGAAVTLDSVVTRFADRLGRVQFTTTRGPHTLRVVLAGYEDMIFDVIV